MELPDLPVLLLKLAFEHCYEHLMSAAISIVYALLRLVRLLDNLRDGAVMDSPLPIHKLGGQLSGTDVSADCSGVYTELSGSLGYAIGHGPVSLDFV